MVCFFSRLKFNQEHLELTATSVTNMRDPSPMSETPLEIFSVIRHSCRLMLFSLLHKISRACSGSQQPARLENGVRMVITADATTTQEIVIQQKNPFATRSGTSHKKQDLILPFHYYFRSPFSLTEFTSCLFRFPYSQLCL